RRGKLEHLCRYIARPPISTDRLTFDERGRILYRLRHPYRDGTTHIVFTPTSFLKRLCPDSCRAGLVRVSRAQDTPLEHLYSELLPAAFALLPVLRGRPLAFTDDREPCAIDDEMHGLGGSNLPEVDFEKLASPGQSRVVRRF
ncbi:MAG: hypothetical protein CMJ89_15850, partial [Planctomycetes bacterium]|nr:hypothetical protein [Planctomycetota bacterium]